MSKFALPAAMLAVSMLAAPAFAQNGGDRTPAGGAFMSSYANSPYRSQQAPARDGLFMSGRGDVGATGSIERRRSGDRR